MYFVYKPVKNTVWLVKSLNAHSVNVRNELSKVAHDGLPPTVQNVTFLPESMTLNNPKCRLFPKGIWHHPGREAEH